jgi:hypothetical protein
LIFQLFFERWVQMGAVVTIARPTWSKSSLTPRAASSCLARSAAAGSPTPQPHVVEITVDHIGSTRSGVAGMYNRSELMDKRKEALERRATHVQGLVLPCQTARSLLSRKGKRK